MAKIPDSTRSSLHQRLAARAAERWPRIDRIATRFRAGFAYADAVLDDGDVLKLCRLRYGGYANMWGFAIYRASHQDYKASYLPTGQGAGTAEDARHRLRPLPERPHRLDPVDPRRTNENAH